MAGHIRTLQKCPNCGENYPKDLVCCNTRPTRYFIDIWWNGRIKIYTDPYGYPLDSHARTDQLLSTIRHQIGAGNFDPREYIRREIKNLLFANYVQAWLGRRELELERRHISKAYMKEIKRYVRVYFLPFFGQKNIRDIRDGDVEDFRNQLPPHLSTKSVRNILGVLHRLFFDAARRKDMVVVPTFPTVAREEPDTQWITQADQENILSHCKEPYRTLFLFCMKHGVRAGEARALRWDKVDLHRNRVTICAGFDLENLKHYTKDKKVRILHLHSGVREALLKLPRSLNGFVFVNSRGKWLSQRMVVAHWQRAAEKAGIKINCHQGTRHSWASQRAIAGYSLHQIGAVLGHSTPAMTKRYAKVCTEEMKGIIEDCPSGTVRKLSVGG